MNTLYIMVGCPGAGKSTFIREFFTGKHIATARVSRDDIRFSMLKDDEDYFAHENEVFQTYVNTIATDLMDGIDVIADATHLNIASRRKLISAINSRINLEYNICFIYIKADLNTCIRNNAMRSGRAKVPDSQVNSMFYRLQAPTLDEAPNVKSIMTIERSVKY